MKTFIALLAAMFLATASHAGQTTLNSSPSAYAAARTPDNYLIRVDWHGAQGETNTLEVLSTEGQVEFDGLQKNSVKINNNDVPATLKLTATLTPLTDVKARLQLFLGRTVPYVTGSSPGGMSSYSQISVGLQSTIVVTFGKPVVIQSDANGTITVLVTRQKA